MNLAEQTVQDLICPACARTGSATWAEPDRLDGRRRLVSLSGFAKTEGSGGGQLRVACQNCGATQPV